MLLPGNSHAHPSNPFILLTFTYSLCHTHTHTVAWRFLSSTIQSNVWHNILMMTDYLDKTSGYTLTQCILEKNQENTCRISQWPRSTRELTIKFEFSYCDRSMRDQIVEYLYILMALVLYGNVNSYSISLLVWHIWFFWWRKLIFYQLVVYKRL